MHLRYSRTMPSFIELDRLFSPFAPGVNPHVDAGAL
jgi:hypothetical protein